MIRTLRSFLAFSFLAFLTILTFFVSEFWGPVSSVFQQTEVTIPPKASARKIARLLASHGVVPSEIHFLLIAKLRGQDDKLNPGTFRFDHPEPVWEVVNRIATTCPDALWITIPEGYTLRQIADVLDENMNVPVDRFLELAKDKAFLSSLGLDADSLEGYLFPDTYLMMVSSTPEQALKEMVHRFKQIWSSIGNPWDSSSKLVIHDKEWSPREMVILASIIQREGRFTAEYPHIAGVFLNRLAGNIKMESCATVRYVTNDWSKRLSNKDVLVDSPYNTYIHKGLPPGPICNPGREALAAALTPLDTDDLYFVARGDGWHEFTKNYDDHLKAKKKYQ